ncbi:cellulase-like family protein [Paenibacillus rhizolycopersici]|uniref:cellulase-like family protein n=1 Tax=Paenibacillus rhizolycopersici TaxID=2780073 RepID=UPI003D2D25D5
MRIPDHLPRKLTISLWDFSWYTMTRPGEPYCDLASRFDELVERGYNTIRICAMPFFLFDEQGRRPGPLRFSSLGEIGRRTRWYNCQGGAELDGYAHLQELFRQAQAHGCYVILSSWEYQQSPSFLESRELADQLQQIPPHERFMTLARSMSRLIDMLKERGYRDQIAYAELHNEVEFGGLAQIGLDQGIPFEDSPAIIEAMKPYLEEAVGYLKDRHPDILITACYTLNSDYGKEQVAQNVQIAHFHLYLNGVLQELMDATNLRSQAGDFPNEMVKAMLREEAPPFESYRLAKEEVWRLQGNPVGLRLFYLHDWADPDKWDLFLYDRYHAHKLSMLQKTDQRYAEVGRWARRQGIPVVIGEGYVGYTPLLTGFEEGPVGKFIAEYAVQKGLEQGFWGMVLCSNCAPHHPFWQDVAWQKRLNQRILEEA